MGLVQGVCPADICAATQFHNIYCSKEAYNALLGLCLGLKFYFTVNYAPMIKSGVRRSTDKNNSEQKNDAFRIRRWRTQF